MDLGQIITLLCGIVLGYGIAKPRETARMIRGFLGGLGRGAERANRQYSGRMGNPLKGGRDRYEEEDDDDDRPRRRIVRRKRRGR